MVRRRSRVLVGVTVAVVLLVGMGVAIVLLSRSGGGVALPDEVDGVPAVDSEAGLPGEGEKRDEVLRNQQESRERIAERFAEAYDGADADVRTYGGTNEDDGPRYTVLAIELDAGTLLPDGLDDPEYTGYAVPLTEVVTRGDTRCILRRTQPPLADADYEEEEVAPDVVVCQRSSGSLTVRVSAFLGPTVDGTAEFLDAVWDELG